MYIPLLIATLYLYKMSTKLQPFYNINLNTFRGGIFGFFIFVCLFSILQSIININSILLFIGSAIIGLVGFLVGAFTSNKFYKKCIDKIYSRYKTALDINDPDMVLSDDEIEEEEEYSDEEDEQSESTELNNNDALISVTSDSQEDSEQENNEENSSYSSQDQSDSEELENGDDDELTLFNSIYKISKYFYLH